MSLVPAVGSGGGKKTAWKAIPRGTGIPAHDSRALEMVEGKKMTAWKAIPRGTGIPARDSRDLAMVEGKRTTAWKAIPCGTGIPARDFGVWKCWRGRE